MNPPSTTAELLVSQFAPAVLLTLKQVSKVTGQAEQTIRNLYRVGALGALREVPGGQERAVPLHGGGGEAERLVLRGFDVGCGHAE